jgi:glutathione peroxidase|tara:strand:- start:20 stop:487 length:468 start_codon:yes stop_codon:yes gene_type:complete
MSSNIHHFEVNNIDSTKISLSDFKGKTVLIVNVASACGFTPQYTGLQALYEKYKDQGLEILAFPCNQFGGQESGTNEEIKTFCDTKYNVTFPLFDKVEVKGENASPLFKFLEDQSGREIQWNFSKFLINKDGEFVKGFGTQKTPEMIEDSIKEIL